MKKLFALLLALTLLVLPACSEEPAETTAAKEHAKSGLTLTKVEHELQVSLDSEIVLTVNGTTATHEDEGMFPYGLEVNMVDPQNVYSIVFENDGVDSSLLTTQGKLSETLRKDATELTQADLQTLQPVMQMITLLNLLQVDTSTITIDDLANTIANKEAYTQDGWKIHMDLEGTTALVVAEYEG